MNLGRKNSPVKVAISSIGPSLDASIDPRFGRCQYHVIVDTDTMEFDALPNAGVKASSGAGISAAQAVAQKGVKAVITGNLGPNATAVLTQAGIDMYTGVNGNVRQAVKAYKNGELTQLTNQTVGFGYGRGMGGGRGLGQGRGMGRGYGRGMVNPPQQYQIPPQSTYGNQQNEKVQLTQQLKDLENQMKITKKRIEELK
jgi:predicted Fe-Mo cluster-binding NifX family protein